MTNERFQILIQNYLSEQLTESERVELVEALEDASLQDQARAIIGQQMHDKAFNFNPDLENLYQQIEERTAPVKIRRMGWIKYAAAAAIIGVIAISYFLLQPSQPISKPTITARNLPQSERFKNDIKPGRTGAILKLSDGRVILLDTARNGQLLEGFEKNDKALTVSSASVQYAKVTTPKSHIQKLYLADGTAVWLNAGSSIRFPTSFAGNTREVLITGEAYFEVAKNASKPFIVSTGQDKITVLGTHFNVNTYAKQVTTLLEGAIRLEPKNNSYPDIVLKAGQQFKDGQLLIPDTDIVMAWKNEKFLYDGAGIQQIMQDVERWYDVEIDFKDTITFSFVANVSRYEPVSELLKVLEATGDVKFLIEGRKITVLK